MTTEQEVIQNEFILFSACHVYDLGLSFLPL